VLPGRVEVDVIPDLDGQDGIEPPEARDRAFGDGPVWFARFREQFQQPGPDRTPDGTTAAKELVEPSRFEHAGGQSRKLEQSGTV
jgi:hypothetical protein